MSSGGIHLGLAGFTDGIVISRQGHWHLHTVEATSVFIKLPFLLCHIGMGFLTARAARGIHDLQ
jgi:uncharacterized membrane protein